MSTIPLNLETDTVVLPQPALPSGVTLEQALRRRHSTRSFAPDPLPLATLSALLWSAVGINRTDPDRRTAPSAHNWQEIDVYAVLAEGVYRYDPQSDRRQLARALGLKLTQRITLAQTVGYPGPGA